MNSTTGARSEFCATVAERVAAANGQKPPLPSVRTPEEDFAVAIHEAGHVVCSRYFNLAVGGSTIIPSKHYNGLTWGSLDRAAYDDHDFSAPLDVVEKARPLIPKIGESHAPLADFYLHCRVRVTELLAAEQAELHFFPDQKVRGAAGDKKQARQFAELVCSSPTSVDAYLEYCRLEAAAIVAAQAHIIRDLALTLVERRTLDGEQIDIVIADAVTADVLRVEKVRRVDWASRMKNADEFPQ